MNRLAIRSDIHPPDTVVVKVGSRIVSSSNRSTPPARIRHLVEDIAALRSQGIRVILVSSGAIAQGVAGLKLSRRPREIPLQQACASVGQIRLMHMYETLFGKRRIAIGQVLLTWDDLRDKKRYLNLRNTLFSLLDAGAVPIVNENDSVGIDEIRFGDNDTLGAQIAMLVGADLFVNLSDICGLFDGNPRKSASASHIPHVEKITPAIHALAEEDGSSEGVGGMVTKLKAADMVTKAGIYALIGDGYHGRLLRVLCTPRAGTLFRPSAKRMSSRRRWIAFAGRVHGALIVDDGAKKALAKKGRSLLPAGVREVIGAFGIGDMVDIRDSGSETFARGMVNYASVDIDAIRGRKSSEIAEKLGQKTFDEIVHRDNLVLL